MFGSWWVFLLWRGGGRAQRDSPSISSEELMAAEDIIPVHGSGSSIHGSESSAHRFGSSTVITMTPCAQGLRTVHL